MTQTTRSTAPAAEWDELVVIVGGTSFDGVWFPEKHLAVRLASYVPVLYVDPPMSALRTPDRFRTRLVLESPRLARLTPVVPPRPFHPGVRRLSTALTTRAISRAVRRLGATPRAVIVANHLDLFGSLPGATRVLYATDDFVAGSQLMGVPPRMLVRDEARQAEHADRVVAVSPALVTKWRALGHDPVLIPNGVDAQHFRTVDAAPVPTDVHLRPPIAGFVGHLSDRIDVSILEAVAARGVSLLLVGPRQATFELSRVEKLLARPNVQWVGGKPFADLPSYVGVMDVGLTPYADTEFNRASFPLKTLEYLAAGRPAVTTDLPATRWLDTDLITVADTPAEFAEAVVSCLADAARHVDEEKRGRRLELAAEHAWDLRVATFAELLGVGATRPAIETDLTDLTGLAGTTDP